MMDILGSPFRSGGTVAPSTGGTGDKGGLYIGHISRKDKKIFIPDLKVTHYVGGGLIEIRGIIEKSSFSGGGVRGKVTSFSNRSRFRLIKFISKLNHYQDVPLFVTLTYPLNFSVSYSDWKTNLDTFSKRFNYKFPKGSFVWKLEPQKRGAPHYHLILFPGECLKDIKGFRNWLSRVWYEVVGSGDLKHKKAGVQADYSESWDKIRRYTSKYMGKTVNQKDTIWGEGVGRFWGVRYRKNLAMAVLVEFTVTRREAYYLLDMLTKFKRSNYRKLADKIQEVPFLDNNKDLKRKLKMYRKKQKKARVNVSDTLIVDYGDYWFKQWVKLARSWESNAIFEKSI